MSVYIYVMKVCVIVNFGYFFIESSAITTTGTTTTGSTAGN